MLESNACMCKSASFSGIDVEVMQTMLQRYWRWNENYWKKFKKTQRMKERERERGRKRKEDENILRWNKWMQIEHGFPHIAMCAF